MVVTSWDESGYQLEGAAELGIFHILIRIVCTGTYICKNSSTCTFNIYVHY